MWYNSLAIILIIKTQNRNRRKWLKIDKTIFQKLPENFILNGKMDKMISIKSDNTIGMLSITSITQYYFEGSISALSDTTFHNDDVFYIERAA